MKRNIRPILPDTIIIIIYIIWAILSLITPEGSNTLDFTLTAGITFVFLLDYHTKKEYRFIRFKALRYSFTFILSYLCTIGIMARIKGTELEVNAFILILTGTFLQSIYYVISVLRRSKTKTRRASH